MYSKSKPWRSEKYLSWVRQHDCENCGKPANIDGIDAHHINEKGYDKGVSLKIDDSLTIPLCRYCHNLIHANHSLIDQPRATLLMLVKAIRDGVLVIAK